ncbi:hypothetical protein LWI28_010928 [Acer negundo]|uniref:Uncharacterized protein n=1 Tax=Acer negundo TaxID=4023 RepID=A0AAD5IDB3_ACENE|nr:hypothetical protein LWI28_010928 [Acer negundo]
MVCFVVPWSFISIKKPYGILLVRVVENKSFSKNISLSEITYHDQISNLPDLLALPPGFPYGGMEIPRLVFLTQTVIKGDASRRVAGLRVHHISRVANSEADSVAKRGSPSLSDGEVIEWRVV